MHRCTFPRLSEPGVLRGPTWPSLRGAGAAESAQVPVVTLPGRPDPPDPSPRPVCSLQPNLHHPPAAHLLRRLACGILLCRKFYQRSDVSSVVNRSESAGAPCVCNPGLPRWLLQGCGDGGGGRAAPGSQALCTRWPGVLHRSRIQSNAVGWRSVTSP